MEDFNELFSADEINQVLDEKRDPYRKEIGDRVDILDFSSCTHLNGMELDMDDQNDNMEFNKFTHFIVIETNQNYIYDAYYKKYKQDISIFNPLSNLKYRINSGHVKLR